MSNKKRNQSTTKNANATAAALDALAKDPGHALASAMADFAAERKTFGCYLGDIEELDFVASLGGIDFKAGDIAERAVLEHGVSSTHIFDFFFARALEQTMAWTKSEEVYAQHTRRAVRCGEEARRGEDEAAAEGCRALEILGLARVLERHSIGCALDAHLMESVLGTDRAHRASIVRLATVFVSYVFEGYSVETDDIQNISIHARAWVRRLVDVQGDLLGLGAEEIPHAYGDELLQQLVAHCVLHAGNAPSASANEPYAAEPVAAEE